MSLRTRVLLGLTLIAVLARRHGGGRDADDGALSRRPGRQPAREPAASSRDRRSARSRRTTGRRSLRRRAPQQASQRPSPVFVGVIVDDRVRTVFAPDLGVDESSVPAIDVEHAVAAADGAPFTTDAKSGSSRFRVRAIKDPTTQPRRGAGTPARRHRRDRVPARPRRVHRNRGDPRGPRTGRLVGHPSRRAPGQGDGAHRDAHRRRRSLATRARAEPAYRGGRARPGVEHHAHEHRRGIRRAQGVGRAPAPLSRRRFA